MQHRLEECVTKEQWEEAEEASVTAVKNYPLELILFHVFKQQGLIGPNRTSRRLGSRVYNYILIVQKINQKFLEATSHEALSNNSEM